MTGHTSITEPMSPNLDISVISTGPEFNLHDPVWAINWFDVKGKWIYDLYNVLAAPHVNRVKGKSLFKGKLIRRLEGNESLERQLLLIVQYPSPERFLSMIKSKVFQVKSFLRILAVRDFTFGFMKRRDDGDEPKNQFQKYRGKLIYLVHHFQNGKQDLNASELKELATSLDIFTHFVGSKSHLIGQRKRNQKLRTAPFFMDGLLVFGAFEESQFMDLIQSTTYQEFMKQNNSNYLGLFQREI